MNYTICTNCGYTVGHYGVMATGVCPSCYQPYSVGAGWSGKARTQKGIGLGVLREVYSSSMLDLKAIVQEESQLEGVEFPCFARPCPSKPAHGYIDSRVVKSKEEAATLLKEVLADDPKVEMILCGFVKASHNMIWTPGSLVIGRGHDGATAGKNTVVVPLSGELPPQFTPEFLAKAKIGSSPEHAWPYVEAVISTTPKPTQYIYGGGAYAPGEVVLTQLRAGPAIEVKGDYIPFEVEVQKVLKADASKYKDRDWELLIDKIAKEKGVVVWHPGGAMTDHFSIHAFSHKIPIIFGEEPAVGQVFEPVEGAAEKDFDPHAMLRGLLAGEKFKLTITAPNGKGGGTATPAVSALLLALHNATACTGEASKWIGFGAAIMLRLGVTALAGEARHLGIGIGPKMDRSSVYRKVLPYSLSRQRTRVNSLVNVFRYGEWPSSGFGGAKWANCGGATVGLFEAVRGLAQNPSPDTAAALVRALNVAVNQAHNGGWWLNKFANQTAFDSIQKAHVPWMLHASPVLYVAGKICDSLSDAALEKFIARLAKWPRTTLKPPKVESVQMIYQPSGTAVALKIRSKLLAGKARMISAPVGEVLRKHDSYVKDYTFITETDDGYRVEVRPPKEEPIVIWQDGSLAEAATKAQLGGA